MKQISSDYTPLLKYILPWTIIILLISSMIGAFIGGQLSLAFGVLIIGAVIVGFMRTMLMNLKKVLLDQENRLLVVKGSAEESIPYEDVKEILRPSTPPYIATVHLIKEYSFGKAFTFSPAGHPLFWENYGEELMAKIRK